MDARDLGRIVHLCIEKSGLGFQVFNAVNDNIVADIPTEAFLKTHAPGTPITRPMDDFEGSISNRKLREVLGFRQQYNWRAEPAGS
ncbi:hypothetical protein [Mesorhizobium sp.]|uniref:hypothetical protein n=1 Tax=Mesorhizobium sp. TaxID=1871066 RepID=UPI0025FB6CB6|nr:hypothetical protein [Mesorhizobium sp.]